MDNLHGRFVGHPKTVDELRFNAELIKGRLDMRAAAVNENHFDADEIQQNDIAHDRPFQIFIDHGIAAVLDDDCFSAVFLDIWQGIHQNLCLLSIGHSFYIFRYEITSFKHLLSSPYLTARFQSMLKA